MLWFARIAEKFDLPAAMLYKLANPRTLRQLRELKERVRCEKKTLRREQIANPKLEELLNSMPESEPSVPELPEPPGLVEGSIKFSSVTFSIQDSTKISQPKTVLDICNELTLWSYKNIPHEIFQASYQNITPDGDDFDQFQGIINWYLEEGTDPQKVVPYIQQVVESELSILGIKAKIVRIDKSNLSGQDTIRLQVYENETQQLEQLPEMNISNGNYSKLKQLLDLDPGNDYSGEISAQDLLSRISIARDRLSLSWNETEFTREPEDEGGLPGQGARFTDPGLDAGRLTQYLDVLEQLVNRSLQMNNPNIVWG